jgi:bacillithiol synthase
MDCRTLPFRQLPHQPRLFLDYLDRFSQVSKFYGLPPTFASVKQDASALSYPADRRAAVAAILREQNAALGAGDATRAHLERFANGAVAIVSGQQVGLFSGPAYSIYKAVSAVQIARELTASGTDAVPVFWMATEDHDLDEVRHSTWFHDGQLQRFELPGNREAALPVGNITLGPGVRQMVDDAARILTAAGGEHLARIFCESYGPRETYGSAFGKLFARLFAEQGLILLNPLDARLHRVGAEILRRTVEQREDLVAGLLARNKELEKGNYTAQVKVTARSTLLFKMGSGPRIPITSSGASNSATFVSGDSSWTRDELLRAIDAEPEGFSPTALLRPVLQDYLLPTAGYIAGAAEIAYFAQAQVIYKKLLGRMTVILPRSGFTLVDLKAEKLLRKYGLAVEDVWCGSQELRRAMETASVPRALGSVFDKSAQETGRKLALLEKQIVKLDPTLGGAVETARKKILFQLEKLRRKSGKAQALKEKLIEGHQEFLESLLYPHKGLQSRELCFLPFLARSGMSSLKDLMTLSSANAPPGHHILHVR